MERKRIIILLMFLFFLNSCAYNPMSNHNELSGNAMGPLVGGAIGAGGAALLGAPKPFILLAGLGGAGIGYYITTLRHQSGAVLRAGGQVYTLGDFVGIEIPSDQLFDSNSAEMLPEAVPMLDSVVTILKRYPTHDILISGNTSGFASNRFEQKLSEKRARQVASYLWAHGINNDMNAPRSLLYVGYGNYFPIANNIRNSGIRANSRIQITASPSKAELGLAPARQGPFSNIGANRNEPLKVPSCASPLRGCATNIQQYLPEPAPAIAAPCSTCR